MKFLVPGRIEICIPWLFLQTQDAVDQFSQEPSRSPKSNTRVQELSNNCINKNNNTHSKHQIWKHFTKATLLNNTLKLYYHHYTYTKISKGLSCHFRAVSHYTEVSGTRRIFHGSLSYIRAGNLNLGHLRDLPTATTEKLQACTWKVYVSGGSYLSWRWLAWGWEPPVCPTGHRSPDTDCSQTLRHSIPGYCIKIKYRVLHWKQVQGTELKTSTGYCIEIKYGVLHWNHVHSTALKSSTHYCTEIKYTVLHWNQIHSTALKSSTQYCTEIKYWIQLNELIYSTFTANSKHRTPF